MGRAFEEEEEEEDESLGSLGTALLQALRKRARMSPDVAKRSKRVKRRKVDEAKVDEEKEEE